MDGLTPAGEVTRVLVVDDDPLVRSAIGLMLGGHDDLRVVGEAGDGREGLRLAESLAPDVVLMDIRMPILNGLEATQALQRHPDPPRVLVLTTFDADDQVVAALAAGADGFLLKDTPPARIVEAVRQVAAGEPMLSPSATRALIERVRSDSEGRVDPAADVRRQRARADLQRLTSREHDVALAVAAGLNNSDIAQRLHLSVPTVKAHVSKVFEKLGADNRVRVAIVVHESDSSTAPEAPTPRGQTS